MNIFNYMTSLNVLRKGNPRYMVFFVTSRCNARCVFCHYWKQVEDKEAKKSELTIDEIEKFVKNYGDIVKLEISGGEPFLREDLYEIIYLFEKYTCTKIVDIPTNGIATTKIVEQTEKMLKRDSNTVLEIQISFDGDREIHDRVKNVNGAFDKLVTTYRELVLLRNKYKNLKIKLNLVYFSENKQKILELLEFVDKEMDVDRFAITYPHGRAKEIDIYKDIGNYREYCKLSDYIYKNSRIKDKSDLHTLLFRAIKHIQDKEFYKIMEEKSLGRYCYATKKMIVIDETGNVYPCEVKWDSLGNLRNTTYNISEILSSEKTKLFQKQNLGKNKCHCTWGNAVLCGIVHNPKYYPRILCYLIELLLRREKGRNECVELQAS